MIAPERLQTFNALKEQFPPKDKMGRVFWKNFRNPEWKKAFIQWEAAQFYGEKGVISQIELTTDSKSFLSNAINTQYPGSWVQLRKDIGAEALGRRKARVWTPEKIQQVAREIYEEHGSFTHPLLKRINKKDVGKAISRYEGGMTQLKQDLGIPLSKKDNYWTPEVVKREAAAFVEVHGSLSQSVLNTHKRGDLIGAIATHYPGGYQALSVDLGLELQSKPRNYWTPQTIEAEAAVFVEQGGKLSAGGMKVAQRQDLDSAIDNYPGGIKALRAKLGISEDSIYTPTVASMENGIPKDSRGRILWSVLGDEPGRREQFIESEARALLDSGVILTEKNLKTAARTDLSVAIHDYYPGGHKGLRIALEVSLPRDLEKYWTDPKAQQQIREESKIYLDKHGNLDRGTFKENDNLTLLNKIATHYKGGLTQLQLDLGQEVTKKPNGYWNADLIRAQAQSFLDDFGYLTIAGLKRNSEGALAGAISRIYPGGMTQLAVDLNLSQTMKPPSYWTQERIETEAEIFFQTNGVLDSKTLREAGRSDLLSAILSRYEGSLSDIQKKCGLDPKRAAKGYWTPIKIESEGKKIFEEHGLISTRLLVRLHREDLLNALNRHYAGGISVLQANLGIEVKAGFMTDDSGNEFVTLPRYSELTGLGRGVIRSIAKRLSPMQFRDRKTGIVRDFYDLRELSAHTEEYKDIPGINPKTGSYSDPLGNNWFLMIYYAGKYDLDYKTLRRLLNSSDSIQVRTVQGRIGVAYKEADVTKVIEDLNVGEIDTDEANADLEKLLEGEEL